MFMLLNIFFQHFVAWGQRERKANEVHLQWFLYNNPTGKGSHIRASGLKQKKNKTPESKNP